MNKNIKILLISVLMFIAMAIFNSGVQAASGNLSASSTSVNVGEKVTITVTVNGASWNLNLSGAVEGSYVDVTDDGGNTSKTFTKTFTPSAEGSFNVTLKGTVTDTDMTKTTIDKTVTIEATKQDTPPAKSNNANLKNLGIRPNDFKGFKSGTTSYDVKVPYSVDKVEVYAQKADEKATVTGTGNKTLNVGKNTLSVEVTAEDGTKKTYTINVTREEKTDEVANETSNEVAENITVDESTTVNSDLTKLEIKGYNITPEFSPNIYEYKMNLTDVNVTKLEVLTEGASEDVKIEVVGNTDLKDGENIITVLVTNSKTKENNTYQIIVNKGAINLDEIDAALSKNIEKVNIVRGIILGIIALIVLSEIIFVIVCYRKRKQMREQENEDSRYEYEEENNLNEEEEYTKHIFNRDKENLDNSSTTGEEVRKIMNDTEDVGTPESNPDAEDLNKSEEEPKEETYNNYNVDDDGYRRNRGKGKHF